MKSKFYYLIYIFVCFVAILFAYRYYGQNKMGITEKVIIPLKTNTIKSYREQFDTNKTISYIWGIQETKKKNDINTTKSIKNENNTTMPIVQKKNQICIGKKCYRFLGIYYKAKTAYITFYSKEFKKGLQDFSLHQTLAKRLFIKKIKANKLFLIDKNSSKQWQFKLFDVNATKYKPKENNETIF